MRLVVYPGTFDPVSCGHEDLLARASGMFRTVLVAVAYSHNKETWFTLQERVEMMQIIAKNYDNVRVEGFSGLLIDFVRNNGASCVLRGLRAVSDFEYEFQLAGMNRYLDPSLETLFMVPSDHCQFVSSTMIREVAALGGDVSKLVHPYVLSHIQKKLGRC